MEPAKGTLDLPGGFADVGETAEEAVAREVMEETGLAVKAARYLFSQTNVYRYSDLDIQTLDLFFACEVEDTTGLAAGDDAAECMWIAPEDIHTEPVRPALDKARAAEVAGEIKTRPDPPQWRKP